jgi:hypothetical protein
MTPTAIARRGGKKGGVRINRNVEVSGKTGFERVVLPGELGSGSKEKKVKKVVKTPPKKAPLKKVTGKKAPATKAPATKASAKKAPAKKTPPPSKKQSTAASPLVRVKTEKTRSSSRSIGYKKGMYNQKRLENIAWRGTGSSSDPVVFL